jgi:hypothetical protein
MTGYALYSLDTPPAPAAPAAEPLPAAMRPANLSALIGRLEQAIEEETAAIRTDMNFDIKSSNARKSRYLYELNRAVKGLDGGALAGHREQILRLRAKLAVNEATIRAHMNAVSEVAALIRSAIERAEADGTYSAGEFGRSRAT